jgi:hypothetical protein
MKTKEELEKALEESLHYFGLLRHAADSQNSAGLADAGILLIEKTLRPPVEYIEVEEIVGWVNVYQKPEGSGYYISSTHPNQESADASSAGHGLNRRISCQPIKVTVSREKKQPVERSVSHKATVGRDGRIGIDIFELMQPVKHKDPDPRGKTGTLTFTWTEEPT